MTIVNSKQDSATDTIDTMEALSAIEATDGMIATKATDGMIATKAMDGMIVTKAMDGNDARVYTTERPRHSPQPLRILVIATEAPPVRGGIARVVGYLRDGFRARGHSVDILAYPEIGRFTLGEVRLSSLVFKLPRLLRCFAEYDVIHVHGATPTISDVALLCARLCNPRALVIYTHHMDLDFGPSKLLKMLYKYLHHRLSMRADAVIAGTAENLPGDSSRNSVIPFGINLQQFHTRGHKDERFTVLFAGQFRPYKGVQVLLRAMSQVPGARLLLVGQGPEEQIYRALSAELGLDIEFHVGVDDNQLQQLYQRAHTVILPSVSRLEAFGLTLVEGMAAGCIPIASDLPGVREVVGKSGFLFPVGDADALAQILSNLRDNRGLVESAGDHAYVRATEFDQERTVDEYEQLIAGLVMRRNLRTRFAQPAQSIARVLPQGVGLKR